MPVVASVGLVPAVRLAHTCRYLKQLQTEVIGTVCKRLCSRLMTPPPLSNTRIPRIIPEARTCTVCSVRMKLALESTWLHSFVEEIDCLHMSTGAIVACSHAFAHFHMLAQVSLPQGGWGSPRERTTTFARVRQNLLGGPRAVNIWYAHARRWMHDMPPRSMWFLPHDSWEVTYCQRQWQSHTVGRLVKMKFVKYGGIKRERNDRRA